VLLQNLKGGRSIRCISRGNIVASRIFLSPRICIVMRSAPNAKAAFRWDAIAKCFEEHLYFFGIHAPNLDVPLLLFEIVNASPARKPLNAAAKKIHSFIKFRIFSARIHIKRSFARGISVDIYEIRASFFLDYFAKLALLLGIEVFICRRPIFRMRPCRVKV
jgi:hypothetical protein